VTEVEFVPCRSTCFFTSNRTWPKTEAACLGLVGTMDPDENYADAQQEAFWNGEDVSMTGLGVERGGRSTSSSRAPSVASRTDSPARTASPSQGWLGGMWSTAKRTGNAVLNPIATTKGIAGTMASSAQNAIARTLGIDPETMGNIMTKPLELLISASTETRDLTALWIQFIVSIIDVLRTQEVTDTVSQYQDTGNAMLQIFRSEEFTTFKDALAAFIASEESTLLAREVSEQSQRAIAMLKTEEVKESTRRLLAFVSKVVSLAGDVNGGARRNSTEASPGRPGLELGTNASYSELLNKIDDLNETEDLLTDHEALRLRKLCRNRNPALMIVWGAFKSKKDEKRLLRGLLEVLEDTA